MIWLHGLCWIISGSAAWVFGFALGRRAERDKLLSPLVSGSTERRIGDYEDQLRRSVGARRMHPNPQEASHMRRAVYRR